MGRLNLADKLLGFLTMQDFSKNPARYLSRIEAPNFIYLRESQGSNFDPLSFLIQTATRQRMKNDNAIPYLKNALYGLTSKFPFLSKNADHREFSNWILNFSSISGDNSISNEYFMRIFSEMQNNLTYIENDSTAILNKISRDSIKSSKNSCWEMNLSNATDNYKYFLKIKPSADHESKIYDALGDSPLFDLPKILLNKKIGSNHVFVTEFLEAKSFMDFLNFNDSLHETYPKFSDLSAILHDVQTKLHSYVDENIESNSKEKFRRLNKNLPEHIRFDKKKLSWFAYDSDQLLNIIAREEDASVYVDFSPQNILLTDNDSKYMLIDFEGFKRESYWYDFVTLFEFGKTKDNLVAKNVEYSNLHDMIKFGPSKNEGFDHVRCFRHFLYGLYAFRDIKSLTNSSNGRLVPEPHTNYARAIYHFNLALESSKHGFLSEEMQEQTKKVIEYARARNNEREINFEQLDPDRIYC